ncbi:hypothetical protein BBI01_00920 [Chryseobacterium artocarpi]|uniref:Uncharacterized protein n=1 Tax=Chryseobacterium artocarpi TaxID=1414727 RepID=A0A1B8ZZM8_9FLAO|nr:hypothetical protein [Chryseobacterium artocarpi]OCA77059.1 hypothetical protein BBI01_00920 [Chryseobacterium artocarpi]
MKRILLLSVFTLIVSCKGQKQVHPIGEEPLNLESFDFNTGISTLFPEKNKVKTYDNAFEIKANDSETFMFQKDTTFVFSESRKPIGFEYRQINWSSRYSLADFQEYSFQKINLAATMDGKIKIIGAVADGISSADNNKLLKLLNTKYGAPKKLNGSWKDGLVIFEWAKKDRIIRFVTVRDNEESTLKIEIDPVKTKIAEGKKNPHLKSYLFVINPAFKNEVFGKLNTGDFVYLDNE